jgi:RNA-binding protein NOB1
VSLQGGRKGDLLLREDQLLTGVWKQRMQKKETLTTMFADCNIADLLAPKTTVGADIVVGYGKRNPNALKGRERRGKPKASKK